MIVNLLRSYFEINGSMRGIESSSFYSKVEERATLEGKEISEFIFESLGSPKLDEKNNSFDILKDVSHNSLMKEFAEDLKNEEFFKVVLLYTEYLKSCTDVGIETERGLMTLKDFLSINVYSLPKETLTKTVEGVLLSDLAKEAELSFKALTVKEPFINGSQMIVSKNFDIGYFKEKALRCALLNSLFGCLYIPYKSASKLNKELLKCVTKVDTCDFGYIYNCSVRTGLTVAQLCSVLNIIYVNVLDLYEECGVMLTPAGAMYNLIVSDKFDRDYSCFISGIVFKQLYEQDKLRLLHIVSGDIYLDTYKLENLIND